MNANLLSKMIIVDSPGQSKPLTPFFQKIAYLKIQALRENVGRVYISESPIADKGGFDLGANDKMTLGGWTSKESRFFDLNSFYLDADSQGDGIIIHYSIR